MEQQFEANVEQLGKRVVIPIPFDPNHAWGSKERHDITGTINSIKIRGPLFEEDGQHFLALGPAWQRDSGIEAGAQVTVHLEPEGPQIAKMADDLRAAFAAAPAAAAFFNTLPTFYRKTYMRWVDSAKRTETRAARVAELIELLTAEKRKR